MMDDMAACSTMISISGVGADILTSWQHFFIFFLFERGRGAFLRYTWLWGRKRKKKGGRLKRE